MECSVCFEQFDSVVRRPKMLACGHSFCLPCLQRLAPKRCPLDNKPFQTSPTEMVDNFSLLQASNNVWCRQCRKDATLACVDEHPVCSRKRARDEEAVPLLESLQRAGAALGTLGDSLNTAAGGLQLADCRGRVRREQIAVAAARANLQRALEADPARWEQAKTIAVLSDLARDAAQLVADLADPSASCSVTVRRGDQGVAWRGEARLPEDSGVRVLLCRLACNGLLRPEQRHGDLLQQRPDGDPDSVEPDLGPATMESHGAVRVDWDREATAVGGVAVARERQRQFFRSADDQSSSRPAVSFLDITCISSRVDVKAMTALLKGGSLEQAHSLVGLQCNVAPAWSQKVLELTAPHLKGLQAVSPLQRHLDRILVMPHLQALCLTNVTGQQARQVSQMASLRRLELHCPLDAPLPELLLPRAVPPAGLRWLRCGVEPLVTALALVQAHASTLEELQLVTASVDPAGCPDLVTELKRCGLKNLHRVVLLRHTAYGEQCRHDHPSCKDQLQRLWLMFGESDLFVDTLCSECDKAELSKSGP